MTSFDDAVAAGGPLVAAWDYLDDAGTKLYLFSIGDRGAQVVARAAVPVEQHEDMYDRLTSRGIRVGGAYGNSTFVWVADDRGFAIWSHDRQTATGTDRGDATGVTLFLDPADAGHRGVQVTRRSGRRDIVAEQHDPTPRLDPTYGRDDVFLESLWARFLGEELAAWFLVPFVDQVSGGGNDVQLAVARAARQLADGVDQPARGELTRSLGAIAGASEVRYRVHSGTLEVVASFGGAARSSELRRGAASQIAAFLRRVSTPRATLRAVAALRDG